MPMIGTTLGAFVPPPNKIVDGKDFYVSYNGRDVGIYGSDTTALVVGQMERFFILTGDHQAQYKLLIPQGLDACLAYYRENLALSHKHSDKLDAVEPEAEEDDTAPFSP